MHLADAKIVVATHRRVFLAPGVVACTDIVLSPPQPTAGACRPSIPVSRRPRSCPPAGSGARSGGKD